MSYSDNKVEVVSFRKVIAPSTEQTFVERIKSPGTIEQARVRFYPGQQKALQVQPYVIHKGQLREDLLTYSEGTDKYLSGDDDTFEFPCVVTVDYDDELHVYAKNTDATYSYTLVIDVVVDYYAGGNRVVGGIA